jgi:hypothetical protein
MKAVTLYPEWVAGIVHLGKPIENRGNGRTPHALHKAVGQRVALHAGKQVGGPGSRLERAERVEEGFIDMVEHATGLICELEDWMGADPHLIMGRLEQPSEIMRVLLRKSIHLSAIYASAVIGEPLTNSSSRWAVPGAWHFPLLDVEVLPVPYFEIKGCLGLWDAPEHIDWTQAQEAERPLEGA